MRDRVTEVWLFENNLKTIAERKASPLGGAFLFYFLLNASKTLAE